MKCPSCGKDNPVDFKFCIECGASLNALTDSNVGTVKDHSIRYHGLDALRAMAMLLGTGDNELLSVLVWHTLQTGDMGEAAALSVIIVVILTVAATTLRGIILPRIRGF